MSYFTLASDTEFSGRNQDVPVVVESAGPFSSLAVALAAWPGFHEASDDEYARYAAYWSDEADDKPLDTSSGKV